MFTGIVKAVSHIKKIQQKGSGKQITFDYPASLGSADIGDSIAVNGVCSTIVALTKTQFSCDYLLESLEKTNLGLANETDCVNLELSLKAQSAMGGHFVSGHIDKKLAIENLTKSAPWGNLSLMIPKEDLDLVIYKGSICIDGISLTIASLNKQKLTVELIPHTIENTHLSNKKTGDYVNIEYDMIGK